MYPGSLKIPYIENPDRNLLDIIDLRVDFQSHCPLCGGKDCARFLQYYTREVIDENSTYFKEFPIARFQCRGKGWKKESKGKTFSLLPYQLVPYIKYSIPFILKVLKARYIDKLSIYKVQEYIDSFMGNTLLTLDADQFYMLRQMVEEAIDKMLMMNFYQENKELFEWSGNKLLGCFIDFAEHFVCCKIDPCIRGPCALGIDFYLTGGGYRHNAYFLFGTPYQLRGTTNCLP